MNRILYFIVAVPCIAQADIIETWSCTETYNSEVLAVAYVNKGRETGEIKVAGITHKAKFRVQGFERRWDFGLNKKDFSYNYAFVVKPNGAAAYYDFSSSKTGKSVQPNIIMKCKMK